jgi:hypothetical protein
MTTPADRPSESDYLWNPDAAVDPGVADLEARLRPLREDASDRVEVPASGTVVEFDARRTQISSKRPAAVRALRRFGLAAAAVLLLGVGLFTWRLAWPDGRAWPARLAVVGAAEAERSATLAVGERLVTGQSESGRVDVARVGTMAVAPGSEILLRETGTGRHRLVLARGAVDVRVWAPAGVVGVHTPAGDVIDIGCAFSLDVDAAEVSRVRVVSGWVQLVNFEGEVLVPAGASSEIHRGRAPLVPVFDEAAPAFRTGLRAAEAALSPGGGVADLSFLGSARPKDVYSLMLLSRGVPAEVARAVLDRATVLVPPPPGVSVAAILTGDTDAFWRWHAALDLPPPKHWWRNWRDATFWLK